MAKIKKFIRSFISPVEKNTLKNNPVKWTGNFDSWIDALSKTSGYKQDNILVKCKAALLKVKNGEAVYERDSVTFDKIQYSWPLLACLESIALENQNTLHVIDFGGSLGSTYFQNRIFFKNISSLKWFVVEQDNFVAAGKQGFENKHLSFETSIENILINNHIHCLVLSAVVQYLRNPKEWFEKFKNYNFKYIIFDRTSFINDETRLTVQIVPEEIYTASYPCWFFNEKQFLNSFENEYELIADFESFADKSILSEDQKQLYWKGFFLKLKV